MAFMAFIAFGARRAACLAFFIAFTAFMAFIALAMVKDGKAKARGAVAETSEISQAALRPKCLRVRQWSALLSVHPSVSKKRAQYSTLL